MTKDWSEKILEGEDRHVEDMDQAYDMTWGRVPRVLGEMAKAGEALHRVHGRGGARRRLEGLQAAAARTASSPSGPIAPTKEAQTKLSGVPTTRTRCS